MKPGKNPFTGNNQEKSLSHERSQAIIGRKWELKEDYLPYIIRAVTIEDPEFVRTANDQTPKNTASASPAIVSSVISMASYQEQKQQQSIDDEKTDADRRADEARRLEKEARDAA